MNAKRSVDRTAVVRHVDSVSLLMTTEGTQPGSNAAICPTNPPPLSVRAVQSQYTDKLAIGPELLGSSYILLTDELRAEVGRERIRNLEAHAALLQ